MQFISLMRPYEVVAELGKRLQTKRLQLNLTQAALARKLGVSVPTISNLENGKNTTLEIFISAVFALGLQAELQNLFTSPALTIADLEKAEKPQRQRASSKAKPAASSAGYSVKATANTASNIAEPTPATHNPRAGLWDKNLFNKPPKVES